jgi:hypothetical protein
MCVESGLSNEKNSIEKDAAKEIKREGSARVCDIFLLLGCSIRKFITA